MKTIQWRVKGVDVVGRFRVHDSRESAERHMNREFQFESDPNGNMKHRGVLQSRTVEDGDDSTWTDEPFTPFEETRA